VNNRIALIGIIVENHESSSRVNSLLHEYGSFILGRMGIPHPGRNIGIISIALEAPADIISALSGKLGNIPGVSTKTIFAKLDDKREIPS